MKSYNYQPSGTLSVTTTGNIAQLDPQGCGVVLMNNATLSTIQGIKAGVPGQMVVIVSIGAGNVGLSNQNGSAAAADRLINTNDQADTILTTGFGTATYQYDEITARWRMTHCNQSLAATIAAVSDTGVGTQTLAATFSRTDATPSSSLREVGIGFFDANNGTLVGGITGVRFNSSANYLGGLGFYVHQTSATPGATFADLVSAMLLDSSGRLGIGITPSYKLHVFRGEVRFTGNDPTNTLLTLENTLGSHIFSLVGGVTGAVENHFSIYDQTAAATRLIVFDTGGVSIGNTTDPGTANLGLNGKIANYNTVTTAGIGVPAIYAYNHLTGQTTNITICSYTPAANGEFMANAHAIATSGTGVTGNLTIGYTDPDTNTAVSANIGGINTGEPSFASPISFRAKGGVAITWTTTGVGGSSPVYAVTGWISQIGA